MTIPVAIAVFAHNEGRNIERCLESLDAATAGFAFECFVLANGCVDDTTSRVARICARDPRIRLSTIALGDKANAWNAFVHELAGDAAAYVFLDGDCRAEPQAIARLVAALDGNPEVLGAAAVPRSGRNAAAMCRQMVADHDLMGNLYALHPRFVANLRARHVRLPVGTIGEDSLVGALLKWDLDPLGKWSSERISVVPDAGFAFTPLSPWLARDWRLYWNRLVRYRLRAIQLELLHPRLKQHGVASLPAHIRELYPDVAASMTSPTGLLNRILHGAALRRIKPRH